MKTNLRQRQNVVKASTKPKWSGELMDTWKTTMALVLALFLCCGLASTAHAGAVKRIILFNDGITQQMRAQFASEWASSGVSVVMDLPAINGMVVLAPDTIAPEDMAQDPRVKSVTADQKISVQGVNLAGDGGAGDGGAGDGGATVFVAPAATPKMDQRPWGIMNLLQQYYDPAVLSYHLDMKNIPAVIKEAATSKTLPSLKIALFDTGIDLTHSKLKDIVKGGIDLVTMTPGIPMDDNGHGSHVAGTLAVKEQGAAYGVQLYAVKVLDRGTAGDVSTLVMALQWAMNNGMNLINMSIAYQEDDPAVHLMIQKAQAQGIVMVAAAGNQSNWETIGVSGDGGAGDGGASSTTSSSEAYPVMYPAKYPEVIAVSAMTPYEQVAAYANSGPEIDVMAPGSGVLSTNLGGGYGVCSGTSMATPHVTGAVALMMALDKNKKLKPYDFKNILRQTALNGKLDVVTALQRVKLLQ